MQTSPITLTYQPPNRCIGKTRAGRSISWYVDEKLSDGTWREEVIPADVVGLSRPIMICRASRKTNLITHSWHGNKNTFCPPIWWDLAIGSGPCGLGCRACFLMLTHRIRRDPLKHLLYDNIDDFLQASEKWLKHPGRRPQHTLGIGVDRSDSLLYEGVNELVRSAAPIFGNPDINSSANKLVLLTKSTNTHYLDEIKPSNRSKVIVSFSLNPDSIADLWEGKWPDTKERITPSIKDRLEAASYAQELGYEIRARIDPILTPNDWTSRYAEFISFVKRKGIYFTRWTLGTYRQKNAQLDAWRERWGLPPMEWENDEVTLVKDGTHWHLSTRQRIEIYRSVHKSIKSEFPEAIVSLCKETHDVRKSLGLNNPHCNCLS